VEEVIWRDRHGREKKEKMTWQEGCFIRLRGESVNHTPVVATGSLHGPFGPYKHGK